MQQSAKRLGEVRWGEVRWSVTQHYSHHTARIYPIGTSRKAFKCSVICVMRKANGNKPQVWHFCSPCLGYLSFSTCSLQLLFRHTTLFLDGAMTRTSATKEIKALMKLDFYLKANSNAKGGGLGWQSSHNDLLFVVDSSVIQMEGGVAGINSDRDWAYCGSGELKGRFISSSNVYVSCREKNLTMINCKMS